MISLLAPNSKRKSEATIFSKGGKRKGKEELVGPRELCQDLEGQSNVLFVPDMAITKRHARKR